ncbi:hypothetical protein ACI78R_11660 [Geodermatophilus sp. SYSU D01106]
MTAHIVEDAPPASVAEVEPTAPTGRFRRARVELLTWGAYVVAQVAQLAALRSLDARFFWLDDAQSQFGPMTWWLGRNLEGGRPPLMDPEQGMAGNLAADMQYGVLDPLHWGLQALAAQTDDFLTMAWGFALLCVLLLGSGVLALLRHHRVAPWLAVAGALGVASSGFYLWYGSSWWPLLWSVAWLPWFWWALQRRGVLGPLVLGLATWALLASGNPYVLFFAGAAYVLHLAERFRDGGLPAVLDRDGWTHLAAAVGGLVLALPTLLTTVQISGVISRLGADPVVGNAGFAVPNLVDVLLGGPTLMAQTNAWGGDLGLVPAMTTMTIAVPVLALVDWRRALRAPGVLTVLGVVVLAAVFTQLPTTVSVFRYPLRYVVVLQVLLPVLSLVAVTAAPHLTRRRWQLAGILVLAQVLLACFRAPVFLRWHAVALVLVAAALAAFALRLRAPGRRVRAAAAVALVVLTSLPVLLGELMMVSLQDRVDVLESADRPDGMPFRALYPGWQLGTTVEEYRDRSVLTDGSATVLTFDLPEDLGWADGVLAGNGNLAADFRAGTGSFAVWQRHVNEHWCQDFRGITCGDPGELLEVEPTTGEAWIDLLAQDTVLLDRDAPAALREHFERAWTRVGEAGAHVEYRRDDDLPGRVTSADGVEVSQPEGGFRLAYADEPMDTYRVSTGAEGGTVVLRIPAWPGLEATLDGRTLPLDTVDGAVLRVEVPAGTDAAELVVRYLPVGQRILLPAVAIGALAVVGAALAAGRSRRMTPATAARPATAGGAR